MRPDARVAARNRLFGRHAPGAVGGENFGNGLGHAKLRVEVDRRPARLLSLSDTFADCARENARKRGLESTCSRFIAGWA